MGFNEIQATTALIKNVILLFKIRMEAFLMLLNGSSILVDKYLPCKKFSQFKNKNPNFREKTYKKATIIPTTVLKLSLFI